MVAPECAPFSKEGGLADMVSSLSKELAKGGHDVKIFTPLYSRVKKDASFKLEIGTLSVHLGLGVEEFCSVWRAPLGGAKAYFAEFDKFFARRGIYNEGSMSYGDNGARFTFLSKAAIEFCAAINWIPDVIHCHDWTTGFVPMYLNTSYKYAPIGSAATVFTIHNLQHQGIFPRELLDYAGLPSGEVFRADNCEALGNVNMMKGAIYNSTKISTVSPTYASEIRTPEYGCGLDPILRFKAADMVGIVNGIDYDEWSPQADKFIPANFSAADMSGKEVCKRELQKRMGLNVDKKVPIFGVVSRLYDQKGLDLLAHIIDPLMANMNIQIAVLGSGEPWLQDAFSRFAGVYSGRVGAYIGYDNALSHLIEAGSDFFVMPSRFEPCGLNQIYSMVYGTLPIVRNTGGLADTVSQYMENDASGTGFVFYDATTSALYNTIGWACSTYYDRKPDILKLRKQAMQKDFSWKISAKKYSELYLWAKNQRRG
ncbi:MAG: glycogen synthase GlgA, partial [Opitutales bacterium]|nr:glycogen synthase GlgA [Opitutales bacterium]